MATGRLAFNGIDFAHRSPLIPAIVGQTACLSAAFLWAMAVFVFRRPVAVHGARTVNLAKCLVATALLAVTVAARGSWPAFAEAPPADLVLIAISGLLGLTLGDTALFAAVASIGVHRTLLLQTLAPLFAAGLAATAGERLTAGQAGAGAVILAGVALVVAPEREHGSRAAGLALPAAGLVFAVLAAFGQGSGVVLAKQGMASIPFLPATLVRLAAASAGLLAVAAGGFGTRQLVVTLRDPAAMRRILPATFVGTYLAMILMMAGVARAPASIAALLLATTPVFSLIAEALIERRMPTPRSILGTLVAVVGVALLTAGV